MMWKEYEGGLDSMKVNCFYMFNVVFCYEYIRYVSCLSFTYKCCGYGYNVWFGMSICGIGFFIVSIIDYKFESIL